jgi:protein-tyrosine phosphatase
VRAVIRESFRRLVRERSLFRQYKRIIERVADERTGPVLIHCSHGKDRTGVVCALLQWALGVARGDIIDDFMLSARPFSSHRDVHGAPHTRAGRWMDEVRALVFTPEPAYIEAMFDEIAASHGSVETFLVEAVHVAPDALARLRSELLEPA